MALYDIKVTNTKGEEVTLEEYKGKVLLIVNTATGCG
ncbi:MAG: glutathione peroxidase, partial [Bacilli bacterium]|nr:glutathione peroxidase [Bacilli bacterium]